MTTRSSRLLRRSLAAAALLCQAACAGVRGPYVWVDDLEPAVTKPSDAYLIGVGDLVSVQVWDNEKLSTRQRVRSDGRISVPLLNDVEVAGKEPKQLARELERQLKEANIVVSPRVNVAVEEMKPVTVAVLGAVSRAGTFALEPGAGVAQALASAGGLTDFAHRDRIFVIRKTPQPVRIRFTFESLAAATGSAPLFRLQTGDVVVAE